MRNRRTSSTIYMHLSIMIANTGIVAMVLVLQIPKLACDLQGECSICFMYASVILMTNV